VARDDRVSELQVFQGFGADRFPDRARPRVHGGRSARIQTARLAPPPRLPSPPSGRPLGADRGARRARRPRDDGTNLHARRPAISSASSACATAPRRPPMRHVRRLSDPARNRGAARCSET
jgi:hypothetical protein